MTQQTIAIRSSDLQIQPDGTIPLTSEMERAFKHLATKLSDELGHEVSAYHVAAAFFIQLKMPQTGDEQQTEDRFEDVLNWVLAQSEMAEGGIIPYATVDKMCREAESPETGDRLRKERNRIGVDSDGAIVVGPIMRSRAEHRAKELTSELGRPVTVYDLAATALMILDKPHAEGLFEKTLDWVLRRHDLQNGEPIPIEEMQEAAELDRLPDLPPCLRVPRAQDGTAGQETPSPSQAASVPLSAFEVSVDGDISIGKRFHGLFEEAAERMGQELRRDIDPYVVVIASMVAGQREPFEKVFRDALNVVLDHPRVRAHEAIPRDELEELVSVDIGCCQPRDELQIMNDGSITCLDLMPYLKLVQPVVGPLQRRLKMPLEWQHVVLALEYALKHGLLSQGRSYNFRSKTVINKLARALGAICTEHGGLPPIPDPKEEGNIPD
jgi:hypothetical protein